MDQILADIYMHTTNIQKLKGSKAKAKYIVEHGDRPITGDERYTLNDFLSFLLDPHKITGVGSASVPKKTPISAPKSAQFQFLPDMINYVLINNTGSQIVLDNIASYVSVQPIQLQNFAYLIFTKNLPIGLEAKTLNKIVGRDLIPTWEIQQAYSLDHYTLKSGEQFWLSQKMNGIHATYRDGKLVGRQGTEFKGLDHIVNDIKSAFGTEWMLGGELIRKNVDNLSDNENFRIGTGVLNSDSADKSCIEYVIYEIVSKREFDQNKFTVPYSARAEQLARMDGCIANCNLQNIRIVPMLYHGADQSMIPKLLAECDAKGYEGMILNRDVVYKAKRHNGVLKVKSWKFADLKVVCAMEGSGRLTGTLGALVVDFKGNRVNVGSGYDDATRERLWSARYELIDRVVEVKYKETSTDKKTGLESLQFPIFVQVREEGKCVSYD